MERSVPNQQTSCIDMGSLVQDILSGFEEWHDAGFRACTNMGPGSAQHDPLHEAAQGGLGIGVVAQQGLLQKSPPHIAVVEGLVCQKLQQTLQYGCSHVHALLLELRGRKSTSNDDSTGISDDCKVVIVTSVAMSELEKLV